MKFKLVPALLALGLSTLLGACEAVSENPTQPGTEAVPPQGGAELEETDPAAAPDIEIPAAPDAEIPAAPDAEIPAAPDAEIPAVPDAESTDPQAP